MGRDATGAPSASVGLVVANTRTVGIIGGTILLERQALAGSPAARRVETPYGAADLDLGTLAGVPVALVQRHGRRRDRPPHRINHAGQPGGPGVAGRRARCWRWVPPAA